MKKLIFLALFLVFIVGISFYINTKGKYHFFPTSSLLGVTPSPTPFSTQSPSQPQNKKITLQIKNKKIVSGPATISLAQNSLLILAVTTDSTDTLHIDGYNRDLSLLKNTQVILSFPASLAGKFNIFLNNVSSPIAVLEVTSQ